MSRFVLLGGTFDPIHIGHLALAREAARVLDAIALFVIEPGHRHRVAPVASLAERRRLVQHALASEPRMQEITELGIDGDLATVVSQLALLDHELHVLFGADSARHLQRWNGVQRLQPARLWVVPRSHDDGGGIDGVEVLDIDVPDVSATTVRFALAAGRTPHGLLPSCCLADVCAVYAPVASDSLATA